MGVINFQPGQEQGGRKMSIDLGKSVLLVLDVQNDFCQGGSLAVKEGDRVVPVINSIMGEFYKVIATQDWHPSDHISFASNHPDKKPYDTISLGDVEQILWPDHCVRGSSGADFHPYLDARQFDLILRKGTTQGLDSYSGFFENDKKTSTGLEFYLKGMKIEKAFLCGLTTDYCVFYSAMDAVKLGFSTYLVEDASRGVDVPEGNLKRALDEMKRVGVKIITSSELSLK
jgi:nicotinamidase/pyrazinamidase